MVSKKALMKVTVRFPSIHSLQAFLSENGSVKNQLPEMDKKYFLELETAAEVLYPCVPAEEIAEQRNVWSFWSVVTRRRIESLVGSPVIILSGLVQWGARKRVWLVKPERRTSPIPVSSEEEEKDEEGKGDMTEEEEEEEEAAEVVVVKNQRSERRRRQPIWAVKKPKRPKSQEQSKQIVVCSRSEKRRMVKANVARWSAGRYKMAEENMLKVRGATAGKPIKRPELRNEVGKLIGDTGLLDHLLKHMAGKVAPGGAERFRRRHNPDGAMEYWLESADLVAVRKEAGVQDPNWTPPQGWKLGDDLAQDPICATMFKELWDEIANLKKRDKESREPEEGLAIVNTTSNSLVTSMDWDQACSSVIQLKDKYTQLAIRKSKFDEQMQQASQILSGMEEEIMALKSTMDAPASALMHHSCATTN